MTFLIIQSYATALKPNESRICKCLQAIITTSKYGMFIVYNFKIAVMHFLYAIAIAHLRNLIKI